MNLETEMNAEIKNWNSRTEGKDENKVMAGDIKIIANMPLDVLDLIVIDKQKFDFMYKQSGELKQLCFEVIDFHREFDNLDMTIELDDEETELGLEEVTVKNISAKFLPGRRVDLTMTAQVHCDEEMSGHIHAAVLRPRMKIKLIKGGGQRDIDDREAI